MLKKSFLGIVFAFFIAFLTACEKSPEQVTLSGKTMGTTYNVKYLDNGKLNLPKSEAVQATLDELLHVVNDEMSTYQKESQISRFNQTREVGVAFSVSADFIKVVEESVRLNKLTDGALDITVGPLVNLWGFGPDKRLNKVPSEEQIAERGEAVGIEKLALENAPPALIKKHPNVYIDLSAIAKGFAIDKLSEYLESLGISDYLVEIGGDLRGKGHNLKGEAWRIAIEKPEFAQGVSTQVVIPVQNLGMATSGNYRNYFEDEQGNRLSHIIDPKALRPITHNLASITVLAPTAMTADGLATGLYVLGVERALEIAERDNLAIFLILKSGEQYEVKMSSAFKTLLNTK